MAMAMCNIRKRAPGVSYVCETLHASASRQHTRVKTISDKETRPLASKRRCIGDQATPGVSFAEAEAAPNAARLL